MQCARSFCFAVYLYCIVHSSTSLPLSLYENESDKGPIIEIDSSKLNAAERYKNIVEDGSILARNKRNFDYSDYYSSSSEEGYQLWHVQPSIPYPHGGYNYHHHHHPHHHHDKNCRYPFDSSESEDNNTKEKPGFPQNSNGKPQLPQVTTDKNIGNSVEFTSRTPKVPPSTRPTATTTTTTTTTEYIPIIDIRNLLQRKKRNQISLDDIEDKEFDDSFPSRPLIVSKGYTTSQLSALPLTIDSNVTSENLESESSPKSKNEFIEFEIIPAFVQEFHPHYDDRHFSRRRQAANPYRNRLRVNNQFGREAYPPPPPYGYPPPPPPPHHGFYPGYGYYPPPPPPPHYGYYPPPPALPPPQYRPENQYYQTDLNSSTGTNASASYPYQPYTPENESQSNEQPNKNYSSDTNLRDNIYDIFGTTADAHPSYDIDVRIKN